MTFLVMQLLMMEQLFFIQSLGLVPWTVSTNGLITVHGLHDRHIAGNNISICHSNILDENTIISEEIKIYHTVLDHNWEEKACMALRDANVRLEMSLVRQT